ncbi:MAG: zinc ribbon domain-containing protein [Bacteroidales bacterium]|nr:zinc ribbon domain-containing protein [Bacteroidales bacterium]
MKICPNCGVELEGNTNFCPLCGEAIIDENTENPEYLKLRKKEQQEKVLNAFQKLSGFQKRKLFWEISGILLFSGILITLIIDLLEDNNLSWSKYTVTICAIVFINISLFSFLYKRIYLLFLGSFLASSVLLILLDMFNNNIGWGKKFGIPLLFVAYLIILGLILMIRRSREKELNLITYSLIASGLLSICIEAMISLYNNKGLELSWSLIVIICVLPVSSLLLFIQHRLKRGFELKRFFHI